MGGAFGIGAVSKAKDSWVLATTAYDGKTLVVAVRDMPGYQALAQRLFTQDANVRNVRAFFSLKRAKFEPAQPLPDRWRG